MMLACKIMLLFSWPGTEGSVSDIFLAFFYHNQRESDKKKILFLSLTAEYRCWKKNSIDNFYVNNVTGYDPVIMSNLHMMSQANLL